MSFATRGDVRANMPLMSDLRPPSDAQPQTTEQQASDPEGAHDVLAAEAFAVPAADPVLHHPDPVVLPEDPAGESAPHDVLAAEEFPLPAGPPPGRNSALGIAERRGGWGRVALEAAVAAVLVRALLRRGR